jgi:hypothetical protein
MSACTTLAPFTVTPVAPSTGSVSPFSEAGDSFRPATSAATT